MSTGEGVPEPMVPRMTKRDSNLKIALAGVLVAVVVILALLAIPPPREPPKLTAVITPNPVIVNAGDTLDLQLTVKLGARTLDPTQYLQRWSMDPWTLGNFTSYGYLAKNATVGARLITAGTEGGNGTIRCMVTHNGLYVTAEAALVVNPPYFSYVKINPNVDELLVNRSVTYQAMAMDSLDRVISNAVITWVAPSKIGWTLTPDTLHNSVQLSASVPGQYSLQAIAQLGNSTIGKVLNITAVGEPDRSANFAWYDMFNVSSQPWISKRNQIYGNEDLLTQEYPYIVRYSDRYGDNYLGTGMRLNLTGRNMTEINLNYDPVFIPRFGDPGGGHAVVDWYMQYLTGDQLLQYGAGVANQDDGWIIDLRGTVTLDPSAAMTVLGITEQELANFGNWWNDNMVGFSQGYSYWLVSETERLGLERIYGSYFQLFALNIDAGTSGSNIVLTLDILTWGMEALISYWLSESILPTEWWYEDMTLHLEIDPNWANVTIDTAVTRALVSNYSVDTGTPCWIWQGMLQNNNVLVGDEWTESPDIILQRPLPPYRYSPGSFNLSVGEKLSFNWPDGLQLFAVCNRTNPADFTNVTGPMTVGYLEPNATDLPPGFLSIDIVNRTIEFVGPFDFWTWAKNQTAHAYLGNQWTLLGKIPYGMPYIEFSIGP